MKESSSLVASERETDERLGNGLTSGSASSTQAGASTEDVMDDLMDGIDLTAEQQQIRDRRQQYQREREAHLRAERLEAQFRAEQAGSKKVGSNNLPNAKDVQKRIDSYLRDNDEDCQESATLIAIVVIGLAISLGVIGWLQLGQHHSVKYRGSHQSGNSVKDGQRLPQWWARHLKEVEQQSKKDPDLTRDVAHPLYRNDLLQSMHDSEHHLPVYSESSLFSKISIVYGQWTPTEEQLVYPFRSASSVEHEVEQEEQETEEGDISEVEATEQPADGDGMTTNNGRRRLFRLIEGNKRLMYLRSPLGTAHTLRFPSRFRRDRLMHPFSFLRETQIMRMGRSNGASVKGSMRQTSAQMKAAHTYENNVNEWRCYLIRFIDEISRQKAIDEGMMFKTTLKFLYFDFENGFDYVKVYVNSQEYGVYSGEHRSLNSTQRNRGPRFGGRHSALKHERSPEQLLDPIEIVMHHSVQDLAKNDYSFDICMNIVTDSSITRTGFVSEFIVEYENPNVIEWSDWSECRASKPYWRNPKRWDGSCGIGVQHRYVDKCNMDYDFTSDLVRLAMEQTEDQQHITAKNHGVGNRQFGRRRRRRLLSKSKHSLMRMPLNEPNPSMIQFPNRGQRKPYGRRGGAGLNNALFTKQIEYNEQGWCQIDEKNKNNMNGDSSLLDLNKIKDQSSLSSSLSFGLNYDRSELKQTRFCKVGNCEDVTPHDKFNHKDPNDNTPYFFNGIGRLDPFDSDSDSSDNNDDDFTNVFEILRSTNQRFNLDDMIGNFTHFLRKLEKRHSDPRILTNSVAFKGFENGIKDSQFRLGIKLARSLILGDTFTVGFTGSSNTAGHDNMFVSTYPIQLQTMLRPLWFQLGYRGAAFEVRNHAIGGSIGTKDVTWCLPSIIGTSGGLSVASGGGGGGVSDDVDVVWWESMMNDGGRPSSMLIENHMRLSLALPRRPVWHAMMAGKSRQSMNKKFTKSHSMNKVWDDLAHYYNDYGLGMVEFHPAIAMHPLSSTEDRYHQNHMYINWHPSPNGHRVYAEQIAHFYITSLLIVLKQLRPIIVEELATQQPILELYPLLEDPPHGPVNNGNDAENGASSDAASLNSGSSFKSQSSLNNDNINNDNNNRVIQPVVKSDDDNHGGSLNFGTVKLPKGLHCGKWCVSKPHSDQWCILGALPRDPTANLFDYTVDSGGWDWKLIAGNPQSLVFKHGGQGAMDQKYGWEGNQDSGDLTVTVKSVGRGFVTIYRSYAEWSGMNDILSKMGNWMSLTMDRGSDQSQSLKCLSYEDGSFKNKEDKPPTLQKNYGSGCVVRMPLGKHNLTISVNKKLKNRINVWAIVSF